MAATFAFIQDTGTQTGSPTKGTTRTDPVTACNWKNSGVVGDVYSSYPIPEGANSFEIALAGKFSGTFNNVLGGLWAHTAGTVPTNGTLKSSPACTGDGDRWLYTTPSATTNATLTYNATTAIAITSGVAVFFGATGPEATGKASTMTGAATRYTNYLTTQIQTAAGHAAGDSPSITLTLRYQEN